MRASAVGGISVMQYSSKSDIVCAMLRELIISGELAPSEPLRQRDLAQRFGVSQTPVREALRRLESEGLVVGDAHRGAIVSASRSGMAEENALIRAALEPLGARLAAREITEEQLDVLRQLNDEMLQLSEDDDRYAGLNREFHFTIYQSAASPMLLSMMRLLWQAMPDGPQVTRSHRESAEQHAELIEALAARDGDEAAAITEKHILSAGHVEQAKQAQRPRKKAKRAKKSAARPKS